ncbi:hypothetical protein ANAEL_05339 [Anaerolineales bacterium]|nr:hypothetical protein ANAEL_05339 [Anaerolineales bacterium]
MINFLKKWLFLILLALILVSIFATLAATIIKAEISYAEGKKAECYKKAQEFNPPAEWRWSRWHEMMDSWGDGCEIRIGQNWYPTYLVRPSLK